MYSTTYFALCGVGGLLACASSHVATTPIDVVKCNAQIRPNVFPTARAGAAAILSGAPAARELGFRAGVPGLFKGWAPTIVGYGAQGFCKFGLYELFKHRIADAVGPDAARRHRDVVALAAGAGAEMIGDIFLSPFEAIKVRLQTHPDFARGMVDGLPRLVRQEGFASLYAGLAPLIGRQVPYTVVKFVSFERITDALYHLTPRPKHELTTLEQMGVVVTAGYLAGFLCGVASQPADTLVSLVNSAAPKHHLAAAPLITAAAGATAGATSSTAAVVDVQETARERLASAYRQVGFRGLWKGFWPRVLMIGTITAAQFLVYGGFRLSVGLPTPGGDAHRHDAPVASGPAVPVSRKR